MYYVTNILDGFFIRIHCVVNPLRRVLVWGSRVKLAVLTILSISDKQYGTIIGFERDCMTSGSLLNVIFQGGSDGLRKMDIEELERRGAEILSPREIAELLNCL